MQKINFKESILIPKLLFDNLEAKLKEPPHYSTLERLKEDALMPVDVKLKKYDFRKKFKREMRPSEREIIAEPVQPQDRQQFRERSPDDVSGAYQEKEIPEPYWKRERTSYSFPKDDFDLAKKYRQIRRILAVVPERKKSRAEVILRAIVESGKGLVEWNDELEIILQGERLFGGNVIDGLLAILGESKDEDWFYFTFYQTLRDLGLPDKIFKFYRAKIPAGLSTPSSLLSSRIPVAKGSSPFPFSHKLGEAGSWTTSTPAQSPLESFLKPSFRDTREETPSLAEQTSGIPSSREEDLSLVLSKKPKKKNRSAEKSAERFDEANKPSDWLSLPVRSPPLKERLRKKQTKKIVKKWENL